MPTPTYTPLATVTLGSSAASVTFSSIPATYRDLILVMNMTGATTTDSNVNLTINSDTTQANYSAVYMNGTGSSAVSGTMTQPRDLTFWNYLTGTTRMTIVTQFMDYSATDKHKTYLTRGDNAGTGTGAFAHRWANTNAITSLAVTAASVSFAAGSTFNLYGVIA